MENLDVASLPDDYNLFSLPIWNRDLNKQIIAYLWHWNDRNIRQLCGVCKKFRRYFRAETQFWNKPQFQFRWNIPTIIPFSPLTWLPMFLMIPQVDDVRNYQLVKWRDYWGNLYGILGILLVLHYTIIFSAIFVTSLSSVPTLTFWKMLAWCFLGFLHLKMVTVINNRRVSELGLSIRIMMFVMCLALLRISLLESLVLGCYGLFMRYYLDIFQDQRYNNYKKPFYSAQLKLESMIHVFEMWALFNCILHMNYLIYLVLLIPIAFRVKRQDLESRDIIDIEILLLICCSILFFNWWGSGKWEALLLSIARFLLNLFVWFSIKNLLKKYVGLETERYEDYFLHTKLSFKTTLFKKKPVIIFFSFVVPVFYLCKFLISIYHLISG